MQVLRANPQQAELLTYISTSAKSHWGYAEDVIASWLAQLTVTPSSIAEHPTFVAVGSKDVLGFYQLILGAGITTLAHLWVLPAHMGKGVGRSLLTHALQQAGTPLHIDSDPHAELFYLACGAVRVGQLPAPIAGQPDRKLPQMKLHQVAT